MDKVEDQHLPSHAHIPAPRTAERTKRLWIFALLTGVLVISANLRGALKGTSRKLPYTGCGKHMKPRSHYALPSGDMIPTVALGGAPPPSCSAFHFADSSLFAVLQVSGTPVEEKLAKRLRPL